MSRFLNPRGRSTFGIALCARCSKKFFLDDLMPDPNAPGLMVCKDDLDDFDPYRLPAREEDPIVLPFVRPDVSIFDGVSAPVAPPAPSIDDTVWAFQFWADGFWAPQFWASIGGSQIPVLDEADRAILDELGNQITAG